MAPFSAALPLPQKMVKTHRLSTLTSFARYMDEFQRRQRALEDKYFEQKESEKLRKFADADKRQKSLEVSTKPDMPHALTVMQSGAAEAVLHELLPGLGDTEFRQYLGSTHDLYPFDGTIGLALRVNSFLEEPSKALKIILSVRHTTPIRGILASTDITFVQHTKRVPCFHPPSFSEGSLRYKTGFLLFCTLILFFGWCMALLFSPLIFHNTRVRRFIVRYLQDYHGQELLVPNCLLMIAGARTSVIIIPIAITTWVFLAHPQASILFGLPVNCLLLATFILERIFLWSLQKDLPENVSVLGVDESTT